jgi:hypothetical protein
LLPSLHSAAGSVEGAGGVGSWTFDSVTDRDKERWRIAAVAALRQAESLSLLEESGRRVIEGFRERDVVDTCFAERFLGFEFLAGMEFRGLLCLLCLLSHFVPPCRCWLKLRGDCGGPEGFAGHRRAFQRVLVASRAFPTFNDFDFRAGRFSVDVECTSIGIRPS